MAPGQAIISCQVGGGLVAMSGTSMAAPHMAGVAALLLALKPDINFDEFRRLMTKAADTKSIKEPQMGQEGCYGVRWDQFPNYQYGHGLVDVQAAINLINKSD